MSQDLISSYISEVLTPQLAHRGVPRNVMVAVTEDIHSRLSSLLARWNNVSFRHAILSLGLEEAYFYLPKKNIELRALVVTTIRNSLVEDLHAKVPWVLELEKPILGQREMALLTQETIQFFSKKEDLTHVTSVSPPTNDVFGGLGEKYPLSWDAMQNLGFLLFRSAFQELSYTAIVRNNSEDRSALHVEQHKAKVTLSGISADMDDELKALLGNVGEGMPFYVPSFTRLRRNPDAVFRVLEELLAKKAVFLTDNMYISDGYVAKRRMFLSPSSDFSLKRLRNVKGLSKRHRDCLRLVERSFATSVDV